MMLANKIYSILCKLYSVNKNNILIINEDSRYTVFDSRFFAFCNKKGYNLCKIVNFNNEDIDYKRYPSAIRLIPKGSFEEIYALKTSRIVISLKVGRNFKKKKASQIGIMIPGNEIFSEEYMKNISFKSIRGFDFWVAPNDASFNLVKDKFADRIQQLKYGNPIFTSAAPTGPSAQNAFDIQKAEKKFFKLIELCMSTRDNSIYELFRRCNLKNTRYYEMASHHGYFSLHKMNDIIKMYFEKKIIRNIDKYCKITYKKIFYFLPIKNNRIVIRNFQHKYGDNPKYITEELIKRNKKYDIIWIVDLKKNSKTSFPLNIKIYNNNTFTSWYSLYTAHIWIDNNVRAVNPVKKKGQFYIQTWHGSMGIKKFTNVWPKNVMEENNRITDVCLSNSKFETEVYRTTIWKDVEILEVGHPRNDILFQNDDARRAMKKRVLAEYGFNEDVNILLYAPTFRDEHLRDKNKEIINLSMYLSEYDTVLDALEKRFGGKWVFFERLHYHLCAKALADENPRVVNVSSYNDMQELIFISDIAISDYSSWLYDFVLTRRPGFIFAVDKEKYLKERELYFPLESTPFPVAYNIEDLIKKIETFDDNIFEGKVQEFLEIRGCLEQGTASAKVVDLINTKIFGA